MHQVSGDRSAGLGSLVEDAASSVGTQLHMIRTRTNLYNLFRDSADFCGGVRFSFGQSADNGEQHQELSQGACIPKG